MAAPRSEEITYSIARKYLSLSSVLVPFGTMIFVAAILYSNTISEFIIIGSAMLGTIMVVVGVIVYRRVYTTPDLKRHDPNLKHVVLECVISPAIVVVMVVVVALKHIF